MRTVEVISHCYAKRIPAYADALCYQLSSFLLHPPTKCKVVATVCHVWDDERTNAVLDFFAARTPLQLRTIVLESEGPIGRRCIGRNLAAKGSTADLVWFADCDQAYGDGCLDRLAKMEWPIVDGRFASMIFPITIKISKDWVTGDATTRKVSSSPRLVDFDPADFIDKTYYRAIGGVQIVRGDDARAYGYLNGDQRWQQPRTDGLPFKEFKDDLAFRRICNRRGPIVGVEIENMYRIRHLEKTH